MSGTDASGLVIVDAGVVFATAITHRADALLTTDRGWPSTLTRQLPFEIHVV